MPVRKGKNARTTRIHDNPRRYRRKRTDDAFNDYFYELYGEEWDAKQYNEQVKDEDSDSD